MLESSCLTKLAIYFLMVFALSAFRKRNFILCGAKGRSYEIAYSASHNEAIYRSYFALAKLHVK
jgi:hypothetical protein